MSRHAKKKEGAVRAGAQARGGEAGARRPEGGGGVADSGGSGSVAA